MVRPVGSSFVVLLVLVPAFLGEVRAEKLPLRHFTPQEGLAGNVVHGIMRDSRGFLWFSTNDGLTCFDGHSSITFGVEHGLGDQEVTDVIESSDGTYWVGTARGLSRMGVRPDGSGVSFTNFLPGEDRQSQWVLKLLEDRSGHIWVATIGGLYRVVTAPGQIPVFLRVPLQSSLKPPPPTRVLALAQDHFGDIWAGGDRGLYRILHGDRVERYSPSPSGPRIRFRSG